MEARSTSSDNISPGMEVETTGESLGEQDVDKPKVADVQQGDNGRITGLVVEKGTIFRKKVDVPADRVEKVEPGTGKDGKDKVVLDVNPDEEDNLSAAGEQGIPSKGSEEKDQAEHAGELTEHEAGGTQEQEEAEGEQTNPLKVLGPGLLNGMAGEDPSAVTTVAIAGARTGYSNLWIMLLMLPMLQACSYASAQIGRVTEKGMSTVLKEHYGVWVAGGAGLLLVIGNLALISADLIAAGSGVQLMTGIAWQWFVLPIAALLWYLTVYENYDRIKKIFMALGLVFVTYLVTAVLSKPDWGKVVSSTFIPHIDFSFAAISATVALLGVGLSPYQLIWQARGETEEKRPGPQKKQLKSAALDVGSGVISNVAVSYAIIVATAATLFAQHKEIKSAMDAAQSLAPLVGPFAKYLFAIGLIGSGLIAIPVLLASTSYSVAETLGWPSSLSKKPWQNEGFYLILTCSLVAALGLAALGLDPIQLIFWSSVLQGILAPILIGLILLMGNSRKVMGDTRLGIWTNLGLALAGLLSASGALLVIFGLATGQSS